MTGYVYAVTPGDLPFVKVGHTADLNVRMKQLAGQTPHTLIPCLVLDVGCYYRAQAFERYVLSWLQPWASHGEWLTSIDAVRAAFAEISPAVDVTEDFAPYAREGMRRRSGPISWAELERRIEAADATAENEWRRSRHYLNPAVFADHTHSAA